MQERRPVLVASWIALGAGVLGAIQPRINATLADRGATAIVASLINFFVAWVVIAVIVAMRRSTRHALRRMPTWGIPWWTFTAGLGGVIAVFAGALAANVLGIAIVSVGFYSGQLTASLLVDRSGLRAAESHPITTVRAYGALLALVAVGLTQVGRPVGEVRVDLIAFVVAAGATTAFQAAFNGRMALAASDPFAATAVNVSGGLLALVLIVAILFTTGALDPPDLPSDPKLYTGGVLGVAIVASFAFATPVIGVLRSTMGMLAAQLAAALVIDWISSGDPPRPGVLAGAGLISVAVAVVNRQPATTRLTVSK